MKISIRKITLTPFIFLFSFALFGQEKKIEGRVTTFDSIPIINASVEVRSTGEVTYTDSLGYFMVACSPKDKLKIRAHGFSRKNVRVKEKTKLVFVNLRLLSGPENRKIAIGYGHVKDEDKLYAVSTANENDVDFSKYSNIYDIIMEMFPTSVRINNDGTMVIRGTATMDADNTALLILDGREIDAGDFANINTVDIANINLLKDASAAVYGSRGANGVIIVETKRGDYQ